MPQKLFKRQRNSYYCGPAVMQMALAAAGLRVTQTEVAERAGTNAEVGTMPAGLVAALESYGLKVDAAENRNIDELRQAIDAGRVAIICYTERHLNWGHYAIVAGFENEYIELLDPAERGGKGEPMTIAEFESRWHDPLFTKSIRWAALISAPRAR